MDVEEGASRSSPTKAGITGTADKYLPNKERMTALSLSDAIKKRIVAFSRHLTDRQTAGQKNRGTDGHTLI